MYAEKLDKGFNPCTYRALEDGNSAQLSRRRNL